MENMSAIVLEQADRLFQQHLTRETLSAADQGQWPAALWSAVEEAGLPTAFVPKEAGGVGLGVADVGNLIRRSAFHSVPLPLAETIIANRLWADAGGELFDGAVTLAPVNVQDRLTLTRGGNGYRLSGIAYRVP
jgi:acyl-CoA dehydrogenase